MALKKRKLGTALLQLEKGSNELLADRYHSLNEFAVVNEGLETEMICFTVQDYEGVYFWASTLLYDFLKDNVDVAEYDEDTMSYSFPDDLVEIMHAGKVPVKSDPTKSCNVWKIRC